jgi:DNA-binding transcriptional MerR regulator
MRTDTSPLVDAVRLAANQEGYIAIIGGRSTNFPSWALTMKKVRLLGNARKVGPGCVLGICTRFVSHSDYIAAKNSVYMLPGYFTTGQIREALEANRLFLEGASECSQSSENTKDLAEVVSVPTTDESVETAPVEHPSDRIRRGDLTAFVHLHMNEIQRLKALGVSISDISMRLQVKGKELLGDSFSIKSCETAIYRILRKSRGKFEMDGIRELAQVNKALAPLEKTPEKVENKPEPTPEFAMFQQWLDEFNRLKSENAGIRKELEELKDKLARIRAIV